MNKYQSLDFPVTEKWNHLIRTKILMENDYFSVSGVLVTKENKINGGEGKDGKEAALAVITKSHDYNYNDSTGI